MTADRSSKSIMAEFGFAGGAFTPVVRWDARAGRMFRDDKVDGVKRSIDITSSFTGIIDVKNMQRGWILFATGMPPNMVLAPIDDPWAIAPSDSHRRGLRVMLKLANSCGGTPGVAHEISTCAKATIRAILELHINARNAPELMDKMLPVVALKGSEAITSQTPQGKTTNYRPQFAITKWVPRPPELPLEAEPRRNSALPALSEPDDDPNFVPEPAFHDSDDF
jgi:hypothetical protein